MILKENDVKSFLDTRISLLDTGYWLVELCSPSPAGIQYLILCNLLFFIDSCLRRNDINLG